MSARRQRTLRFACALALGTLMLGALGPAAAAARDRSPRITWYFGLRRPEAAARDAFFAVQSPGSASYRRFATLAQVSSEFGAGPRTRGAFLRQIKRLGLSARIDPSGVFARVRGSVRQFQRIFKVRIKVAFNNDVLADSYFPAGGKRLALPAGLRPLVQDVVDTYDRSAPFPKPARPRSARTAAAGTPRRPPRPPLNHGTWTQGCRMARATGAYSYAQARSAYGVGALGTGAGGSVAILNAGEGVTAQDLTELRDCFGLGPVRTRTVLSDGQRKPFGHGSFEPEEDVALVRGMAPGLSSIDFAQVWLSPELWFLGADEVMSLKQLPDTFTISYGECERDIRGRLGSPATRAGANLLDSLLVRLGLRGVGSFASAGDFGSTCDGQPFAGVAWPGSSPYLTSVGGTRLVLNAANQRAGEVVWNDLRWRSADAGGGVGGGGLSGVSPRPPFQRGLSIPGTRRAVPDVAADASSFPGWPVVLAGNWVVDGGTSASSPLLAGAFAALSADERAAGRPPLGPIDGLLYALQKSAPAALFDVVSGANGYERKVPAWHAKLGYDLASGLGVPQFGTLAQALPAPAGDLMVTSRRPST